MDKINITTQEQLTALYAQFSGMKFNRDRESFCNFFYDISETSKYFFKEIRFNWDNKYPTSKDIDNAHSALVTIGAISLLSYEPEHLIIRPFCKRYFNKFKDKLTKEQIGELEKIAQEFKIKLKVKNVSD